MSRPDGAPGYSSDEDEKVSYVAYLLLGGLGTVVCAIVVFCVVAVVGVTSIGGRERSPTEERAAQLRNLPVYWTVRRGDTYDRIARRTGLSVGELETFNPRIYPAAIRPGQRLKLRAKVPPPKPKPPGPKWAIVRTGDSFGSIAAKNGKSAVQLQRLNRKLTATALQPGDRVRLR